MSKKTLEQVDALLQVKGNQPKLLASCQEICNSYNPFDKYKSHSMGHGRNEYRDIYVFNNQEVFRRHIPIHWMRLVKVIIKVDRRITKHNPKGKGKTTRVETSYFVSNKTSMAKKLANHIRKHWWIENKLNYVKDVSMGEDRSRIRINAQNMVILRDFGLNLLRKNMKATDYVGREMLSNCMDLSRVLNYQQLYL